MTVIPGIFVRGVAGGDGVGIRLRGDGYNSCWCHYGKYFMSLEGIKQVFLREKNNNKHNKMRIAYGLDMSCLIPRGEVVGY